MKVEDVRYWHIVDWINPESESLGMLKPKLFSIFGSDSYEDDDHYYYSSQKKNFILNYKTQLIYTNSHKLGKEKLSDKLLEREREFKKLHSQFQDSKKEVNK